MRPTPKPQVLSAEELTELTGLAADLRVLRIRLRQLIFRVRRAREGSARALVRDRLQCVVQDSIAPAFEDLRSILAEGRERRRRASQGRPPRAS